MIPTEIDHLVNFLKGENITLTRSSRDARTDSVHNEQEILNTIKRKKWDFEIIEPDIRDWYDFAIKTKSYFLPVNIKVSNTTHADNLNCKLGIYYALSGKIPMFPNEIRWEEFFRQLKKDIGTDKDKDYYFIVFNKNDNRDIFANSLRGLKSLQPNGNNLPFQCKWNDNRDFQKRSFSDAVDFLLGTLGMSIKLRSRIYLSFKEHFAKYA